MVERTRTAARERKPEHREKKPAGSGPTASADDHSAGAGHEQQAHDARLRERYIVAHRSAPRRLAAERRDGEHAGGGERKSREGDVEPARGDGRCYEEGRER